MSASTMSQQSAASGNNARMRTALIQGFHAPGYSVAKARAAASGGPVIEYDPAIATEQDIETIATTDALRSVCDAFHSLADVNTARIMAEDAMARGDASSAPSADAAKPGRFVGAEVPSLEKLTLFHSKTVPGLSLAALVSALQDRTKANTAVMFGAIVIIARYCAGTRQPPNAHTQHRLYVAALFVSAKIFWDRSFRVSSFAKHAGVGVNELRKQERTLVQGADWHVIVTARDIEEIIENVVGGTARGEEPRLSWFLPASRPALGALGRREGAKPNTSNDESFAGAAGSFNPGMSGNASISTRGNFSQFGASNPGDYEPSAASGAPATSHSQYGQPTSSSAHAGHPAAADSDPSPAGSAMHAVRANRR